jgi:DNA-binding transcriptional regulator YdaS (Cro superfamily)
VEIAGGEEKLAELLRTSPEVLSLWLSGAIAPPLKKYLAALELVTHHAIKRRPSSAR